MTAAEYRVFGLAVRSEFAVPALDGVASGASAPEPDVRIRKGAIAHQSDPDAELSLTPEGALLTIPRVARYLIRDGTEILVDPHPESSARNVQLFLLGSAFAVLLHQRGIIPLHANAVVAGGKAYAFAGKSGTGKSTLAWHLHARGYRVLCDDVCAIDPGATPPLAHVGIPRMRLWRDAIERAGGTADGFERAFDGHDKFNVPATIAAGPEAAPLGGIFLLAHAPDDAPSTIAEPLTGMAAVQALISNTYRGRYLGLIGSAKAHWQGCLRIAEQVPVHTLTRPWGEAHFPETLQAIEAILGEP